MRLISSRWEIFRKGPISLLSFMFSWEKAREVLTYLWNLALRIRKRLRRWEKDGEDSCRRARRHRAAVRRGRAPLRFSSFSSRRPPWWNSGCNLCPPAGFQEEGCFSKSVLSRFIQVKQGHPYKNSHPWLRSIILEKKFSPLALSECCKGCHCWLIATFLLEAM